MTNLCECGRSIYTPPNRTITAKRCPSCELKFQTGTKEKKSFGFSFKTKNKSKKSNAMRLADEYFSQYIRLKHSIVSCGRILCKDIIYGKLYDIKDIDNGHYISRGFKAVRYNENNCRPQNRSSNRFKGEEHKEIFREHLIQEIGEESVNELDRIKNDRTDTSEDYYRGIATKYRLKIKELCKERNIFNPF